MENKKQLVIVPPMSEPLQKLNEVLNGIAGDENIEISLIDDGKELSQFLGSAGQCLVVFSNAKRCATFLQENRFAIAKVHSKVILLTPKEIPAKTLIKFTKIGLTESILESSPPKTLLYKVKLLLRSIKTSTVTEEKDHIVKSMLDTNQPTSPKGDINTDKLDTENLTEAPPEDQKSAKFKKEQEEISIRYDNLRGKSKYQEEIIETNWKSKRKRDDETVLDLEAGQTQEEEKNLDDMDMYYRGKAKKNIVELDIEEDLYAKKTKNDDEEEETNEYMNRRKVEESEVELEPGEKKKSQSAEENVDDYNYKQAKETEELIPEENEDLPKKEMTEEEEIEAKKKELAELDALFEEVNKRHKEKEVEDLGGHYKGKINNTQIDLEDDSITEENEKEYDNSSLEREKLELVDLDLTPAKEDKRRVYEDEEEDEKKGRKENEEELGGTMSSDEGETDHIETFMKGGVAKSKTDIALDEEENEGKRKNNEDAEEASDYREKRENETELDLDAGKDKNEDDVYDEDTDEDTKREKMLDFDSSDFALKKLGEEKEEYDNDKDDTEEATGLKLVDGEHVSRKGKKAEEESDLNLKKMKQTDLGLDGASERNIHDGKVEKIDTYYRSGEGKKAEHSWDNLTDLTKNIDLGLQKGQAKDEEKITLMIPKNAGEITIDYRKLKEEFEALQESLDGDAVAARSRYSKENGEEDDEASFKVIVPEPVGLDFGITILNLLYTKDTKANDLYTAVGMELLKNFNACAVFYTYKVSEKKHVPAYDSIQQLMSPLLTNELKEWWFDYQKEEAVFNDYYSKSMPTWICRSIPSQSNPGSHWEDVELPSWAQNELTDKKVELVYPYFDGVDRAGIAIVYFPEGLNPKQAKAIEVTLEMARSAQLDSIQRKIADNRKLDEEPPVEETGEKKNILGQVFGLFNKKKAG